MGSITVAALYKFVHLDNPEDTRLAVSDRMEADEIRGTILVASEGINGTIAGKAADVARFIGWLRSFKEFSDLEHKESFTEEMPFLRARARLKKEIVTLGVPGVNPAKEAGTYVEPRDWNTLISDPDVLLIDTRNEYEVEIGTFKGAVNPGTESFRQFPEFVDKNLDPFRDRKVAMFCTGGIRCEKSTAYLRRLGFEHVFHLQGGILKYLEEIPEGDSLWEGECFVFDERVAVDHSLEKGSFDQCHACRRPITEEEMQRPEYEAGVSCHKCINERTPEQRARYAERERQMRLAEERGEHHIGADAGDVARARRDAKKEARVRRRQQEG